MTKIYVAAESTGRYDTTFYMSYPPVIPYKHDINRGNKVTVIDIINYYGEKWAKIQRHDNNLIGYVKLKNIKEVIEPSIKDKCLKIQKCYISGYEPPEWSCQNPDINLMKQCRVFYDKDSSLVDVMKLVKEREPVNIAMDRFYNKDKLQEYFGYKIGYYHNCSPEKTTLVPPNIVVYTPCRVTGYPGIIIHILHAIGLAFDIDTQPDYIAYHNSGLDYKERIRVAISFYIRMFKKLFIASKKINAQHIVLSLVGANNFASEWEGGILAFQKDVWVPAYQKAIELGYTSNIKVSLMGGKGSYAQTILKLNDIGYFPACIKKINPNGTVFVNAWDCWSIPGNGNNYDNSLDGHIGRNTDSGVNGTSLTNPYLENSRNYIPI